MTIAVIKECGELLVLTVDARIGKDGIRMAGMEIEDILIKKGVNPNSSHWGVVNKIIMDNVVL